VVDLALAGATVSTPRAVFGKVSSQRQQQVKCKQAGGLGEIPFYLFLHSPLLEQIITARNCAIRRVGHLHICSLQSRAIAWASKQS